MTISDALRILGAADWLKISQTHVTASRYDESRWPHSIKVRLKREESFEEMLVRAAAALAFAKRDSGRPSKTKRGIHPITMELLAERAARRMDRRLDS